MWRRGLAVLCSGVVSLATGGVLRDVTEVFPHKAHGVVGCHGVLLPHAVDDSGGFPLSTPIGHILRGYGITTPDKTDVNSHALREGGLLGIGLGLGRLLTLVVFADQLFFI